MAKGDCTHKDEANLIVLVEERVFLIVFSQEEHNIRQYHS